MMRDTVYVLSEAASQGGDRRLPSPRWPRRCRAYVPGYRLKQKVQFEVIPADKPVNIPGVGQFSGLKTAVYLEVEGAAHYLPAYAVQSRHYDLGGDVDRRKNGPKRG
ncbi:Acetaldehyde dehydrogenase [Kluyvera cryocrescens]|uniref:Acetaldehyde dehydrogenase n=1 Tax=Kluyvera cryocrescens TaxID=580 RepID=A0A485BNC8_KLUCR|nr:Acetaldehyde dehydrogenase [Kluyvera cryocrescens]